jgi:hypothetical protein
MSNSYDDSDRALRTPDVNAPADIVTAVRYCALPEVPERVLAADIPPNRVRLIQLFDKKWVNGTVLHYYFFDREPDGERVRLADGTTEWRPWTGSETDKGVVREAFRSWKEVGVGLQFRQVDSRDEAEIRIGFMRGDGSWSYIGRDVLEIGRDNRTMNFGWGLTGPDGADTALHEIGHTLGFPHEHQNPNAGLLWDEEAVYSALAAPPNNWPRQTTYHNIIRKIPPDQVRGSNWDPNSVMHYPFGPGLIREPAAYRSGLAPAGGLSAWDREYALTFYSRIDQEDYEELRPMRSAALSLRPGEQKNFIITPDATRNYTLGTFGWSDTVLVLFEEVDGELRYRTGDDDSGEDRNARFQAKLYKGRKYVLRVRLYWADLSGETAVMMW